MGFVEAVGNRRSIYALDKNLPVSESEVEELIKHVTELVPDAFNMKSARVIVAFGKKHDELWDAVFDSFGGKVSREKLGGFKSAAGTILYFYDDAVVKSMQEKFTTYAANFPVWANQANGMLQFSIWTALREKNIGANIQHYNPVINANVSKLFDVPESWVLLAQMPFGGIVSLPDPKPEEDITLRVKIEK